MDSPIWPSPALLLARFQCCSATEMAHSRVFPTWVVAADFNGDGKLDLGVANASDSTVSVLSSILLKPSAPADAAVVNSSVNAAIRMPKADHP
jgi:FG-GAP repeat